MARPGRASVGPAEFEMMILGRHISLARASEYSRVPSGRAPRASCTAIHLAQSTGVVTKPPAAPADDQFQTSWIDWPMVCIAPWYRSGGPTRPCGRADLAGSAAVISGRVSLMPSRSRIRVWTKSSQAMPEAAATTSPATTNIRLQ